MFASSIKDVRGVDLSYSLIPSWDVVALIVIELPALERLFLKYVLAYVRHAHHSSLVLATIVFSHRPTWSWGATPSLVSQSCN
jgi:hypothetical protein